MISLSIALTFMPLPKRMDFFDKMNGRFLFAHTGAAITINYNKEEK